MKSKEDNAWDELTKQWGELADKLASKPKENVMWCSRETYDMLHKDFQNKVQLPSAINTGKIPINIGPK